MAELMPASSASIDVRDASGMSVPDVAGLMEATKAPDQLEKRLA